MQRARTLLKSNLPAASFAAGSLGTRSVSLTRVSKLCYTKNSVPIFTYSSRGNSLHRPRR